MQSAHLGVDNRWLEDHNHDQCQRNSVDEQVAALGRKQQLLGPAQGMQQSGGSLGS